MSAAPDTHHSPVMAAFLEHRTPMRDAAWLSLVSGVLMIIPSWFMFEVYGRVLNSRNLATLWWLVLLVLGAYVVVELLELARARVLEHIAAGVERKLRARLFDGAFNANLRRLPGGSVLAFNDLKTIRDFIVSPVLTAALDIPAALVCMGLLYLLSPWLGLLGLVGALIQVGLIALTERRTMPLLNKATEAAGQAQGYANATLARAPVIYSMGMLPDVHALWLGRQHRALGQQAAASDYAGTTSAVAKMVQTLQGSILLGAACWIALEGKLLGGAGMAIVASIIGGRALQPLAQLVPHWRTVIQARDANARITRLFAQQVAVEPSMELPAPVGLLTAEAVIAGAPGGQAPILRGVSFVAKPGQVTVIVGPSASGKTTLARLIVGVWPCQSGKVRLDGADVYAWNKAELGPHIGYLPQNVELFDGTVAENIARFGDVDRDMVQAAAQEVGLHETIEALPLGYDSPIGADGTVLSGGQRQRLGLARALYGQPRVVVLDEPNSSLDEDGEKALQMVLAGLKARQATVVAITHRASLLQAADAMLVLQDGLVAMFGPRDEVLAALRKAAEAARAPAAPVAPAVPAETAK